MELAIEQVAEALEMPRKPKVDEVFNDSFLPPKGTAARQLRPFRIVQHAQCDAKAAGAGDCAGGFRR